jgi:hypothetical protein
LKLGHTLASISQSNHTLKYKVKTFKDCHKGTLTPGPSCPQFRSTAVLLVLRTYLRQAPSPNFWLAFVESRLKFNSGSDIYQHMIFCISSGFIWSIKRIGFELCLFNIKFAVLRLLNVFVNIKSKFHISSNHIIAVIKRSDAHDLRLDSAFL